MRLSVPWLVLVLLTGADDGVAQRRGPGSRGPGPVPGPKVVRPNPRQAKSQLDRLRNMTPEDRRRAMENLPPGRQKEIEERLDRFEKLTPEERQRLSQQYEVFQQMPAERREALRRLYRRFNEVPEERRELLRSEMQSLRSLSAEERGARMNSDEFRNRYTATEQQLLADIDRLLQEQPPPPAEPRP